MNDEKRRFRINAHQTAKNYWQIEATAEAEDYTLLEQISMDDIGNTIRTPLGLKLLSMIKETEKAFRADGRQMVGDPPKEGTA